MHLLQIFLSHCGIQIPCSQERCDFCSRSSRIVQESASDPIREWSELISAAAHPRNACCVSAREILKATKGTTAKITSFCYRCQERSRRIMINADFELELIDKAVNFDMLSLPTAVPDICPVHSKQRNSFHCLGDVPQYIMVRTRCAFQIGLENSRLVMAPLQLREEGHSLQTSYTARETFLCKSFYISNPCYRNSGQVLDLEILGNMSLGGQTVLLIRTKNEGYNRNQWNLTEVARGTPYGNNTGVFKILESISCPGGAVFPAAITKPRGEESYTSSFDEAQRQRRTGPEVQIPEEEGINSDTDVDIDEDEDGYGYLEEIFPERRYASSYWDASLNNVDILGGSQTTSIPFLFAPYTFLHAVNYKNDHYEPRSDESIGLDEARQKIESDYMSLFAPGKCKEDFFCVGLHKSAVLSPTNEALRLSCDIDSLDILTYPWGGMAFSKQAKIFCQYNPRYSSQPMYHARNNNLTGVHQHPAYPGEYFVDRTYKKGEKSWDPNEGEYPLGIRIFDIQSFLSVDALKVRALVPIGCVKAARLGNCDLLRLFMRFVNGGTSESSLCGLSERVVSQMFFWYIIREHMVSMLSLITEAVLYPVDGFKTACCAVPVSGNKCNHDRRRGVGSSFDESFSVEGDVLALSFYLSARFFAALEDLSQLPNVCRTFKSRDSRIIETYECPESLSDSIEDSDLRACLRADTGSDICLSYFQNNLWNDQLAAGGFLKLGSNPERRGRNALPGSRSNIDALERGYMHLEDLLLLAPVVFRCTEHGMKKTFSTSVGARNAQECLQNEFDIRRLQDGIVDIGYTLKGPAKKGWAVTLPKATAKSNLLVPIEVSHRTERQQKRSYYTTAGYPQLLGLSTDKARVGCPMSALSDTSVRRVKCYSSKRRIEATRGATCYDIKGTALTMQLKDHSALIRDWMNLRLGSGNRNRSKSVENERRRTDLFSTMIHDMERRIKAVESSEEGFGVRLELTCSIGSNWECVGEAFHLLKLQEKRRNMSNEEFTESFRSSPQKWPWFLCIPSGGRAPNLRSNLGFIHIGSMLPVTILPCKSFVKLNIAIEKTLLTNAEDIYRFSLAHVSNDDTIIPRRINEFYRTFLEKMTRAAAVSNGMLMSRAMISMAGVLLGSVKCSIEDLSLKMAPFTISACGMDASWYFSGVPQVICSRILSLSEINQQLFHVLPTHVGGIIGALKQTGDIPDSLAFELDDAMGIPDALTIEVRQRSRGFAANVLGPQYERDPNLSRRGDGCSLNTIVDSLFDISTPALARESLKKMATLLVLCLVADCCHELEKMLGCAPPENAFTYTWDRHKLRMYPSMRIDDIVRLTRRISRGQSWEHEHRINGFDVGEEDGDELACLIPLLLQFATAETNGISTLNDEGNMYRNSLTEPDGTVGMNTFIQELWKRSGMLPSFSEVDSAGFGRFQDRRNRRAGNQNWRSITVLRIVEGLVGYENTVRGRMEMSFSTVAFQREFPAMLSTALQAAGFHKICPLLVDHTSLMESSGAPVKMWGPHPVFTKIQPPVGSFTNFIRDDPGLGGQEAQESITARFRQIEMRDNRVETLSNFVRERKTTIVTLERDINAAMMRRESDACQQAKRALRREMKKTWEGSNLRSLIMDYLQFRRRGGSGPALNEVTFDYVLRIVEFLISLRCTLTDEGMGAYEYQVGGEISMRSLRLINSTSEQIEAASSAFGRNSDCFRNPWSSLGYPKSSVTRDGRPTKRISVQQASEVLFESGLVFKIVNVPKNPKRAADLEKFLFLSVEEIYEKYRGRDQGQCTRSRSMWRFCPTKKLLEGMETFLRSQRRGLV